MILSQQHVECLLARLDDWILRTIADLRMEEYTVREIADRLGLTTRTIERKLALIRDILAGFIVTAPRSAHELMNGEDV